MSGAKTETGESKVSDQTSCYAKNYPIEAKYPDHLRILQKMYVEFCNILMSKIINSFNVPPSMMMTERQYQEARNVYLADRRRVVFEKMLMEEFGKVIPSFYVSRER